MERCELYDRECTDCGECDVCDLNPEKICDNCLKCIESSKDYATIKISKIIIPPEKEK